MLKYAEYKEGEYVYKEKELGDKFYIVESGQFVAEMDKAEIIKYIKL